jgi:hypothetical protein
MFAVCAALAPRTCGVGDAGEFVLALALAGVPHPSGYPLNVLIGNGFVRLLHAFGLGWTHAANLWSALGAAVALALATRVAAKLGAREPGAGPAAWSALAVALIALAIQPLWIASACFAEIYSWHFAWVAGAMLAGLSVFESAERDDFDATRSAILIGAIAGLGLAHHLTSMLASIPLAAAAAIRAARRGRLTAAALGAGVLAALAPLTAYGWIAWRAAHPAAYQWPPLEPSLAGIWTHISGRIYAGAYLGAPVAHALSGLGGPALALLALACVALLAYPLAAPDPARRALGWALLAGAALQCGFALAYGVPDGAVYFVPVLMSGLLVIPSLVTRVRHANARALFAAALAVALAVAAPGWLRESRASFDHAAAVDARIRELWRAIPGERAIVLWTDDHYTRLVMLQRLERDHPERIVDNPRMLTWPAARRAFQRRSGVDPLAGLDLYSESDVARIPANVQRQTDRPVVIFERFAAEH